MKEENIRKIAQEKGMKETDLFVEFIQKRFPNESDSITSYVGEWVDRFLSGNPTLYMDNESLGVYVSLIGIK